MTKYRVIIQTIFCVSVAAFAVLIFDVLFPNLDLQISSIFFYDTSCDIWAKLNPNATRCGLFWLDHQSFYKTLRSIVNPLPILAAVSLLIAYLMRFYQPLKYARFIKTETFVSYFISFFLGPLIMVTWIVKPLWARSRPFQILDFGGYEIHTSILRWGRECSGNCSFVSGEVASMAWLLLAVQLLPGRSKIVASLTCSVLLVLVALGRLASGRHFMSDAIFAVIVVVFCHCIARLFVKSFVLRKM